MLFMAEGQLCQPIEAGAHTVVATWLGPMVDGRWSMQVMVRSAPTRKEIEQRLGDLPGLREQEVSFAVSNVTALRFS